MRGNRSRITTGIWTTCGGSRRRTGTTTTASVTGTTGSWCGMGSARLLVRRRPQRLRIRVEPMPHQLPVVPVTDAVVVVPVRLRDPPHVVQIPVVILDLFPRIGLPARRAAPQREPPLHQRPDHPSGADRQQRREDRRQAAAVGGGREPG